MWINVLSLFDGMSCGRIALERAGIGVDNYYASEVDKYAIKVSSTNYPDIVHLGDVTKWQEWDINWSSIDLITSGFPCQSWSVAGKQLGDKDERGMLFWVMLDIMKHIKSLNPKIFFLIENVKMKKEFEQYITYHTSQALGGLDKHLINSSLVSAQNRQRYYWTNIPNITQPKDKGILLKDIIEDNIFTNPASIVGRRLNERGVRDDYNKDVPITQCLQVKHNDGKSGCLTTVDKDNVLSSLPPGRYEDVYNKNKDVTNFVDRDKSFCIDANYYRGGNPTQYFDKSRRQLVFSGIIQDDVGDIKYDGVYQSSTTKQKESLCLQVGIVEGINAHEERKRVYSIEGKSPTLQTPSGGYSEKKIAIDDIHWRKLTVVECCRLQTVPDNYFNGIVSNSQAYKLLGNGWTVDVIVHIFSFMKDGAEPLQRFAKENNTENELKLTQEELF